MDIFGDFKVCLDYRDVAESLRQKLEVLVPRHFNAWELEQYMEKHYKMEVRAAPYYSGEYWKIIIIQDWGVKQPATDKKKKQVLTRSGVGAYGDVLVKILKESELVWLPDLTAKEQLASLDEYTAVFEHGRFGNGILVGLS